MFCSRPLWAQTYFWLEKYLRIVFSLLLLPLSFWLFARTRPSCFLALFVPFWSCCSPWTVLKNSKWFVCQLGTWVNTSSALSSSVPASVSATPYYSVGLGKGSVTFFTMSWSASRSIPSSTQTLLRSATASSVLKVPRFWWWSFSLSDRTSWYAIRLLRMYGSSVRLYFSTHSSSSFSVERSQEPAKTKRVFSRRCCTGWKETPFLSAVKNKTLGFGFGLCVYTRSKVAEKCRQRGAKPPLVKCWVAAPRTMRNSTLYSRWGASCQIFHLDAL